MTQKWTNWSGSLRFRPENIVCPESEEALAQLVRRARAEQRKVRVAGKGHSSSPLVETEDILVSLEKFQGVEAYDRARKQATIRCGMTVGDAGKALHEAGLAMHNMGDVDVQTVVGAISTATHGTGRRLQNLSSMLVGVRMVNADGEIVEKSCAENSEFMRAAQVSLGVLGIFTSATLQLLPSYQLVRREWCTHIEQCLTHLDQLIEENRNFDFYWYPRSDLAKLRTWNPPGEGPEDIPFADQVEQLSGWSFEVLPKSRVLKFDEMEYGLPFEAGAACFREVRRRMREVHRKQVGWRVLYRTVAPDYAYLSTTHGRETITISLHQNATLPFWEFFKDMEPIFRAHGGRPHWGKKHTLRAQELSPLYPEWERFREIRRQCDPENMFLTPYLRYLLQDGAL